MIQKQGNREKKNNKEKMVNERTKVITENMRRKKIYEIWKYKIATNDKQRNEREKWI